MMRRTWSLAIVLTLALAGCGSDPKEPAVATAQDGATATPTATPGAGSGSPTPTAASDYDKALQYTRCMTANGVPTKDPVVGEMVVTYNVIRADKPGVPEDRAAAAAAHAKCKHHLPATWPVKLDPAEVARSQKYSDCVRAEGVQFGYMDANGFWQEPTDQSYQDTPEYRAAEAKCRHLVDDPANNQTDR